MFKLLAACLKGIREKKKENNAFLLCEQYGHSQAEEPPPRRVIKFLAHRNYILNYSALLLGIEKNALSLYCLRYCYILAQEPLPWRLRNQKYWSTLS